MQVQRITTEQLFDAVAKANILETTSFGLFQVHRCQGSDGQYLLIDNAGGDCARITAVQ